MKPWAARALEPRRSSARSRRRSSWRRDAATSSSASTRARAPSSAAARARRCSTSVSTATRRRRSRRPTRGVLMPKVRAWFDCYLRATRLRRARKRRSRSRRRRSPGSVARRARKRSPPARRRSSRSQASRRSRAAARPSGRSAPLAQGDRDLRRADGADVDRRERRLVAARRRAHARARRQARRSSSARAASRRERARRGHDPALASQATFVPKGSRLTRHARLVLDRAVELEPPLPRPPDAADALGARVGTADRSSSRACDAGHEVMRASRGSSRWSRSALAASAGGAGSRPGRHVDDRSARRHRAADRRGRRVRDGRRQARRRTSTTSTRRAVSTAGRSSTATTTTPTTRRRPVQLTRRLVEQDKVFADLQLDRHGEQPRDPRLPERAEGARSSSPPTARSRSAAARRSTRGRWASCMSYRGEGDVCGKTIVKSRPKAKIAVLLREHGARARHAHRTHAGDRGQGPRASSRSRRTSSPARTSRRRSRY